MTIMILFGAGSSVPFGIPGMAEFTLRFLEENRDLSAFIRRIRKSIMKSEEMIGVSFPFDLETLLSVLNDLSGITDKKPISLPTASLLLAEGKKFKAAQKEYGEKALQALDRLVRFIFDVCMKPVKKGQKEGNFRHLNNFYGPLMTVLNRRPLEVIQSPIKKIYSTNWDLCFKTWADYVNLPINDGTVLDDQSLPVFSVKKFDSESRGFIYVPLHGSLDLIKIVRPKGAGAYEDILKIPDPIRYFEDKPENIRSIFMIYPLEAVGYEESVKSPYLDMLNNLRETLRHESTVFIIGYSLRDPTIGSIFEEVIAEKIRQGSISPLSQDLDSRKKEIAQHQFKIIVMNPNPEELMENLKKSYTNLLQTFVPVRIRFPQTSDSNFSEKYEAVLRKLIVDLQIIGYLNESHLRSIKEVLWREYKISIPLPSKGISVTP